MPSNVKQRFIVRSDRKFRFLRGLFSPASEIFTSINTASQFGGAISLEEFVFNCAAFGKVFQPFTGHGAESFFNLRFKLLKSRAEPGGCLHRLRLCTCECEHSPEVGA